MDEVRRFGFVGTLFPFIESRSGHEATSALEGGAEAGFFGHGLGASVEQRACADFFGPVRHESPAHGVEVIAFVVTKHYGDGLRGRDVESGDDAGGVFTDKRVSAEDGLHDGGLGESSTHYGILIWGCYFCSHLPPF